MFPSEIILHNLEVKSKAHRFHFATKFSVRIDIDV